MKIDFNKTSDCLTVNLDGRLDTVSAPEFEAFLEKNLESGLALTVDCEKLTYISSAGLRVLLIAQKKIKDSMKLINVCDLVMEVLEITGLADILVIE